MSNFQLHILGCGSATPSFRHMPACQAITRHGKIMIVDCGEGAQLSMRRQHLPFSRVSDVFISHLHGDHILGLPGLLSTMLLHGKGGKVTVHIFEEGAEMLKHVLGIVAHGSEMLVDYNIISPEGGLVYEDKGLTVTAFPLKHGIPCVGFRFDEKPKPRHIRGDMAKYLGIPVCMLNDIRAGADYVTPDGEVIANARLTTEPTPSYSYAYCSDTAFDTGIVPYIKDVNVLYHESTYTDEYKADARARGHSTAAEAAEIARLAHAGRLVLGHYSKRFDNMDAHLAEARDIFPDTIAGDEGMTIDIDAK